MAAACDTRDRLTFPNGGGGGGGGGGNTGPVTVIDLPSGDTTVAPPAAFFVQGTTTDPDGLDTVYFETEGGISSFPPFVGGGQTVRFGLPLTTSNQSGQTITVRVFGTDRLGMRGDTAVRRITVQ